jgi:hypothetical protein
MGEVYRAHDARLRREVAIKVLPSSVAGDEARLARFEQEALATAALNHPNILVVHDIGRAGISVRIWDKAGRLSEANGMDLVKLRDALLISSPANLRYLTGYAGSNGLALVTPAETHFFTDPRYALEASQTITCKVHIAKKALMEALAATNRGKTLGEETCRKMSQAHKQRRTRPPAAGQPWTPEEDELLRKLARSGESVMNITERLNRSDHSVRTRAVRQKDVEGRAVA